MEYILATDWIHNAYPTVEQNSPTLVDGMQPEKEEDVEKNNKENIPPTPTFQMTENDSWLQIIDEDEEANKSQEEVADAKASVGAIGEKTPPNKCSCQDGGWKQKPVPLLDHLCVRYKCTEKELPVLFQNLRTRRTILQHLRNDLLLQTSHLRPAWRNISFRANDLSVLPASGAYAMRGYLGITVAIYFYVKHGIKLRYPNLPCAVQFGGGEHQSMFPLECLNVIGRTK